MLGDDDDESAKSLTPFPFLTKGAVESLRYRAEVRVSLENFQFPILDQPDGIIYCSW